MTKEEYVAIIIERSKPARDLSRDGCAQSWIYIVSPLGWRYTWSNTRVMRDWSSLTFGEFYRLMAATTVEWRPNLPLSPLEQIARVVELEQ